MNGRRLEVGPTFPRKIQRQRNDEKAVGIVVVARPLPGERRHDAPIHPEDGSGEHTRHNDFMRATRHRSPPRSTYRAPADGDTPPNPPGRCPIAASTLVREPGSHWHSAEGGTR